MNKSTKRVLVTGITGLIGKEITEYLKKRDFEIYGITSSICNLFDYDAVEKYIEKIRPTHLIHLAWITKGDYLSNPKNIEYCDASINLLEAFIRYGGYRAVFAGTCFEYEFIDSMLNEDTNLKPLTLYAKQKINTYERALEISQRYNISFAWGRIFYVYGHGEDQKRITASIINNLISNEKVSIQYGQLIRDYMYSKDIANAFATLIDSDYEGAINICSGQGISLGEYAGIIAGILNKNELVDIQENETTQPLRIIGNNHNLSDVIGFRSQYSIAAGLREIIERQLNGSNPTNDD